MKKVSDYIPALTGIRAIAAFLVYFHHYNQEEFPHALFRVFNELHMGVTIFFVLSGFLICLRYYDNYTMTREWFGGYIQNRVARVYPMYFILTLFTFGVAAVTRSYGIYNGFPHPALLLLMNLFFVRGFFDDLKFTGIGQGWSLTVEESFYFLAPFFFHQIRRSTKALYYLPVCILSTGVLLVLVCSHIPHSYGLFGNFTFMFLYTFTGRCLEFFVGMKLALIILKKPAIVYTHKFPLYSIIGSVAILLCIGIFVALPLPPGKHTYALQQPLGIITNNLVLPFAVAVMFYGLICESSWMRRFLSCSLMELLGRSSYIFYLIHMGFIANYIVRFSSFATEKFFDWLYDHEYNWWIEHLSDTWISILLTFILLNLSAITLFKLLEEQLNKLIRKWRFSRKKNIVLPNSTIL